MEKARFFFFRAEGSVEFRDREICSNSNVQLRDSLQRCSAAWVQERKPRCMICSEP